MITYGQGHALTITAEHYAGLRQFFVNRIVQVGTSRTNAQEDSLGAWLKAHVSRTAIASYVAPILIIEFYAERIDTHHIRITK